MSLPVAQELLGSGKMHSVTRSPQSFSQLAEQSVCRNCDCDFGVQPERERVVSTRTEEKGLTDRRGVKFDEVEVWVKKTGI